MTSLVAEPPTRFWEKMALVAKISAVCRRQKPEAPRFQEVLTLIQVMVPFDAASLYLRSPDSGGFKLQAGLGDQIKPPAFVTERDALRPTDWQVSNRRPIMLKDASSQSEFDPDNQFASIIAVPLLIDDEIIGILNLGAGAPDVLREDHLKLMSIVADQLAVSIERLHHIAEIEARNQELAAAHRQLQENQEKLIAAEKLAGIEELAASINHEINNPLAVIVGHAQCMQIEQPDLDDKTLERLQRIEQATLRIRDVNQRLLKISSIVSETYSALSDEKMLNLEKSSERE